MKTSNQAPGLKKVAVDSVAKDYWTAYYADSGYGAAWVKEIPKRVKAELASRAKTEKKAGAKAAASLSNVEVSPLATIVTDDGVTLEGRASYPDRSVKAFVIDFDHDGKVLGFDSKDIGSKK